MSAHALPLKQQIPLDEPLTPIMPPSNKLDADQYVADDIDGVTESLFGSGNMSYAVMQASQSGSLLNNTTPATSFLAGDVPGGNLQWLSAGTSTGTEYDVTQGGMTYRSPAISSDEILSTQDATGSSSANAGNVTGDGNFANSTVGSVGASQSASSNKVNPDTGVAPTVNTTASSETNTNTTSVVRGKDGQDGMDGQDAMFCCTGHCSVTYNNTNYYDTEVHYGDVTFGDVNLGDLIHIGDIDLGDLITINDVVDINIGDVVSTINIVLLDLGDAITHVTQLIHNVTETVGDTLGDLIDGTFTSIEAVTSILDTLLTSVTDVTHNITSQLTDLSAQLVDVLGDVVNQLGDKALSLIESTLHDALNGLDQAANGLQDLLDMADEVTDLIPGTEAITEIAQNLGNITGQLGNDISEMVTPVLDLVHLGDQPLVEDGLDLIDEVLDVPTPALDVVGDTVADALDNPLETGIDTLENPDVAIHNILNTVDDVGAEIDDVLHATHDLLENVPGGAENLLGGLADDLLNPPTAPDDGGDSDLIVDAGIDLLDHTLSTIDAEAVLDPVESVVGDVDSTLNLQTDLLAHDGEETNNAAGDQDLTVDIDAEILGLEKLDIEADIPLDGIEAITGDIDLDVTAALDLLNGANEADLISGITDALDDALDWTESLVVDGSDLFDGLGNDADTGDLLPEPVGSVAEGLGVLDVTSHEPSLLGGLFG